MPKQAINLLYESVLVTTLLLSDYKLLEVRTISFIVFSFPKPVERGP